MSPLFALSPPLLVLVVALPMAAAAQTGIDRRRGHDRGARPAAAARHCRHQGVRHTAARRGDRRRRRRRAGQRGGHAHRREGAHAVSGSAGDQRAAAGSCRACSWHGRAPRPRPRARTRCCTRPTPSRTAAARSSTSACRCPAWSSRGRLNGPGLVRLTCNTHTWMRGFIVVTDEMGAVSRRRRAVRAGRRSARHLRAQGVARDAQGAPDQGHRHGRRNRRRQNRLDALSPPGQRHGTAFVEWAR